MNKIIQRNLELMLSETETGMFPSMVKNPTEPLYYNGSIILFAYFTYLKKNGRILEFGTRFSGKEGEETGCFPIKAETPGIILPKNFPEQLPRVWLLQEELGICPPPQTEGTLGKTRLAFNEKYGTPNPTTIIPIGAYKLIR